MIKNNLFSSPINIALLPLYGYIAAYNYEAGYLSAFKLPQTLVQVNLEAVISFVLSFVILILIVVGLLSFIDEFYKEGENDYLFRDMLSLFGVPAFMIFSILYFKIPELSRFLPIAIGLAVFCFIIYFIWPILKLRTLKKSYGEKLKTFHQQRIKKEQKNSFFFSSDFFRVLSLFVIISLIVAQIANLIGKSEGYKADKFIVFTMENQDYALIRNYSNSKLAIKLKENRLTEEYALLGSSDNTFFKVSTIER